MASHKTLIFVLVPNLIVAFPTSSSSKDDADLHGVKGFRFGDEYFETGETAQASEQRKSPENCEKVMKNSMLCMVCKEPETNAKYEQCSYVSHPGEQTFNFAKSISAPRSDDEEAAKYRQESKRRHDNEESEESEHSSPYSSGFFDTDDDNGENYRSSGSDYVSESEKLSKDLKEDDCEEIEKDGMICSVCKSPKTGGNFEKCSFAYKPKDQVYKFSKSKSFGYPKKDKLKNKKEFEKSQPYRRSNDESFEPEASEDAEEHHQADSNGCHEVIKDSMTCKVCVDPDTKENSEQCSYSYKPDDKLYAYTQSRSFGTPKETSKKSRD